MNLSAQQTLESYIIVLAALCGGLATWLVSGWLVRWVAKGISGRNAARKQAPPDAAASSGNGADTGNGTERREQPASS
ncbi:MAG TPA: hypothetical protein PLO53_10595 [Candidatus Hydrogenedentes bacterium]|nr:hypothetical protein [Candidatus Hydrogenedentota bacterium]